MKRIENQNLASLAATMGVLFLLSGCAVGPNYKPPQTSVANSFANAATNVVSPDEASLATWWKGFNDARIESLVERAITNNHDLRMATANLKEARALRRLTTFDLAPTVQANAGYANSLLSKAAAPPGTPSIDALVVAGEARFRSPMSCAAGAAADITSCVR